MKTRKRRGRGEASIFERDNGRWVGQVSLGYGADGKRVRKTLYGTTKAEVLEKVRKVQTEFDAGRLVAAEDLTVGEYLVRWLAVAKDKTGAATFERYEQLANQYLVPALGKLKLSKLRPVHVETAYANLVRATPAGPKVATANTRKAAGTVLGIALRHAVRLNLIASNPAAEVSKPKSAYKEMMFLTPAQVRLFLAAADSAPHFALLALAVGSGCRMGEMLALTWADIDFEKGTVEVKRSVSQVKGQFIVKEPKSAAGRRTITLPTFVLDALFDARKAALKNGLTAAPVFSTRNGTHLGKSNVRREFQAVIKRANAKGNVMPAKLRFHDLRHSHASCLISAGHSIKAVSRRLGHSDITMTLKVYSHLMPDDDAKLATGTNVLFG